MTTTTTSYGDECPVCGSRNIDGGRLEVCDGYAYQPCRCEDCGAEWEDAYRFDHTAVTKGRDED